LTNPIELNACLDSLLTKIEVILQNGEVLVSHTLTNPKELCLNSLLSEIEVIPLLESYNERDSLLFLELKFILT